MAASHTLIAAAVFCSLVVFGWADPCTPDCSGGAHYFPHPQDCNSFYQCSNGIPYAVQCAPGLDFSPTGLYCGSPLEAGCTADPTIKCEAAAPSQEPGPSSAAPTKAPSSKTCAPKCPWDGAYLPHPQDCSKFYICGTGLVAFEWLCQTGLHYDMQHSRCEHPARANCIASTERACDANLKLGE